VIGLQQLVIRLRISADGRDRMLEDRESSKTLHQKASWLQKSIMPILELRRLQLIIIIIFV